MNELEQDLTNHILSLRQNIEDGLDDREYHYRLGQLHEAEALLERIKGQTVLEYLKQTCQIIYN